MFFCVQGILAQPCSFAVHRWPVGGNVLEAPKAPGRISSGMRQETCVVWNSAFLNLDPGIRFHIMAICMFHRPMHDLWPTHRYHECWERVVWWSQTLYTEPIQIWSNWKHNSIYRFIDIKRAIALIPFTGRGWIPTRPMSCLWPIPASTSGCVGKALPIFVWWDQVWLLLFS